MKIFRGPKSDLDLLRGATSATIPAVEFLREFISQPGKTGAIAPSSVFLARTMLHGLGLGTAEAVLEYGPGTGAFTRHILNELKPTAKFAAIELNSEFAQIFRKRHPTVKLFQDNVTNARKICDHAGMLSVDCIVCGLPWAAFPKSVQVKCLDEMMRVLKPGGRFVTFAYVHGLPLPAAKKFASLLPNYFTSVSKSPVVWRNVPPAFVYRCRR
jgi:phosphatidylethanolamine/phosphatidyl-N-methylethanolamine N-methyltransferase